MWLLLCYVVVSPCINSVKSVVREHGVVILYLMVVQF